MLFGDRQEAGEKLAASLKEYAARDVLVLAVPRGGVVVARPVAAALGAELDVIIPRKVGAPGNPELAVAAVAPDGTVIYNEGVLRALGLKRQDLREAIADELQEIRRRVGAYRGKKAPPRIKDRTVVIIDDGLATGLTVEAALVSLKREEPRELILAVPVAPADTVDRLRPLVTRVVCLATPDPFYAVGQFYRQFPQVEDGEVVAILTAPY
ncbi:phosphoribosyltransferase [Thermanaeromonas sp. C210]|uniref:phosphoribosyltransferase n=1 Tax=Thermanaeromonas sp. C210 TaxID=2731925 RepID=UPI00155C5B01|nr:phosphoribosyltransferase family protein [Thermanaeromonas sp. C210]GFN23095.1 phosphoribosyltransferase [Thermanaeromonas sp. C210]